MVLGRFLASGCQPLHRVPAAGFVDAPLNDRTDLFSLPAWVQDDPRSQFMGTLDKVRFLAVQENDDGQVIQQATHLEKIGQ